MLFIPKFEFSPQNLSISLLRNLILQHSEARHSLIRQNWIKSLIFYSSVPKGITNLIAKSQNYILWITILCTNTDDWSHAELTKLFRQSCEIRDLLKCKSRLALDKVNDFKGLKSCKILMLWCLFKGYTLSMLISFIKEIEFGLILMAFLLYLMQVRTCI